MDLKTKKFFKHILRPLKTNGLERKVPKKIRGRRLRKLPGKTALIKSEENPIISPQTKNGWEAWQTFNPGVIQLEDKVHFLYRAIGEDGISRLGYASSYDGFTIDERLSYPVYDYQVKDYIFNVFSYFSGGSWGGIEDPRIVQVDKEDTLYITYTACDGGLRVALTSIKIDDFLNKRWRWKFPIFISPPLEAHKNWLIFPNKINGKYAILTSINPNIQIEYVDRLEFNDKNYINSIYGGGVRKGCWDRRLRGAGAPPLKTADGWLLFYHATDNDWSKYKVGVMLLDLEDPTKILYRAKEPVLEPTKYYENNGFKPGVVYVTGAVVKNGELLVYYGGSDSYICVAYANLDEFLEELKKETKPKLKLKTLKKKH